MTGYGTGELAEPPRSRMGGVRTIVAAMVAWTVVTMAACGGETVPEGRRSAPRSVSAPEPSRALWELREAASRGDPAGLLRGLVAGEPQVRRRAAEAAVGVDDAALTDALVEALADPDSLVRGAAAFALGLRPAGAPAAPLRRALERETVSTVRGALFRALGRRGDAGDAAWLARVDGADRPAATEALARSALAGAVPSGAVDTFVARLRSPDPEEAAFAARGLVWSDSPEVWIRHRTAIRGALAPLPPDAPAARVIVRAFGRLLPREDLETRIAGSGDPLVRLAAVEALATHSDGLAGVPALERALDDPHPGVREVAARALGRFGRGPGVAEATAPPPVPADSGPGPPPPTWALADRVELAALGAAPRLVVELGGGDTVAIALAVDDAPGAVLQLVRRVRAGRYDGVPVHRVVPGALLQWGRPGREGSGTRPERSPRPVERGVVGLARDGETGDDDLFVAFDRLPELDGRHTLVGAVVEGWGVLEAAPAGTLVARTRVVTGAAEVHR